MRPRNLPRPEPETAGAEGFEVRVIGASPSAAAAPGGGGLEIGLRIGTGAAEPAAMPEATAEVHRLEAAAAVEPVKARPMSVAGPAGPYVPRRRTKSRNLTLWTTWMAAGTCAAAVAAVAGLMIAGNNKPSAPETGMTFVAKTALDQEKQSFLEDSPAVAREAEALLRRYAAARSAAEVLPLVRQPEAVKERLETLWKPWGSEPALAAGSAVESAILGDEGRPALVLSGRKGDFSRFHTVFIREGGQVKLDWEASEGIGEVQVAALREGHKVVKDALVRAIVRPGGFYTPEFPEQEYRSYQLLDASSQEFVWAFVRLDSPAAAALTAEFNEGSVLLEKTAEVRAVVKVSGPLREGVNLFVITEMLHKGWVTP